MAEPGSTKPSANSSVVAVTTIRPEDFPGLHRSSDAASRNAQRTYLILQRLYLGSLILGAVLGAFTGLGSKDWNPVLYTVTACLFALGFLLLGIVRARQDDRAWFDGRAIAESVKTAAWRFMTKAPPFQDGTDDSEQRFVSELSEIRSARPNFGKHLAAVADANTLAITEFMRRTRSASLKERRQTYVELRLRDQKQWYANKAKANSDNGTYWFVATAILQAIALVTAIVQAKLGGLPFNFLSILTTSAAALTAWSQMKRFDELAQTYALAAHELGELDSLANGVNTEAEFSQLVEQSEEASSREHTMWAARRDTRLPGRGSRQQ